MLPGRALAGGRGSTLGHVAGPAADPQATGRTTCSGLEEAFLQRVRRGGHKRTVAPPTASGRSGRGTEDSRRESGRGYRTRQCPDPVECREGEAGYRSADSGL